MPPSQLDPEAGGITREPLLSPSQKLKPEDVDRFLEHLFGSLSRRPKMLQLRQTAAVSRYLMAQAYENGSPTERQLLEQIANILWMTLLRTGKIHIAKTSEVIDFLEEHAQTYLAGLPVQKSVGILRKLPPPVRHQEWLRPPKLIGRRRSGSERSPLKLQDDLTERIFAAYHALRRAGVRNARGRIAAMLNKLGLTTQARAKTSREWGPYEVIERVRQFETRLRKGLARGCSKEQFDEARDRLTISWIQGFYDAQEDRGVSLRIFSSADGGPEG